MDEEYNRRRDCRLRQAESTKDVKKRLSSKTFELIRQRGNARDAGDNQLTSELAKLCREAIKEDLKERRTAVLTKAAEAGKSIRQARRSLVNCETKMTSLRRPDGTATVSRKATEKVIYDFYSTIQPCLPTILGKTDTLSLQFSLPKFDTPPI
uniref:BHLH domain-containing protein n=1 Tax=Haemonchus placei TaxID=6290 RepID=A0A0N4WA19_HAEPC